MGGWFLIDGGRGEGSYRLSWDLLETILLKCFVYTGVICMYAVISVVEFVSWEGGGDLFLFFLLMNLSPPAPTG